MSPFRWRCSFTFAGVGLVGVGLVLAALGVFSVATFSAGQRAHELGMQLAERPIRPERRRLRLSI